MAKLILTGAESFGEVVEGGYFYIDKTLFIKELLEKKGKVTLITRPRRFGKTMNMSMLERFFGMATPSRPVSAREDGKSLFDGLKIMEHADIVERHMNKYPVVLLTLKNVEAASYGNAINKIRTLVSRIYRRNMYLYESDALDGPTKMDFYRYCTKEAADDELDTALLFLAECLHTHHGKRAIVLVDEYDAPISNALEEGYYQDMVKFMRGFLGSVFKTNDSLEFGVLTGVQRIAREGLVSSFNNPLVCGIMNVEFADSFGFTDDEVREACEAFGLGGTFDEVKRWYDGYRFGGRDIYNPWSITMYLNRQIFSEHWITTGSVKIFEDIFHRGDDSLKDEVAGLITGTPVHMQMEDGITYPLVYSNTDAFWTLMLHAGYIKPVCGAKGEEFQAELVNYEVRKMFTRFAGRWLKTERASISEAIRKFAGLLLKGDADGVSRALNEDLLNNPSSHDYRTENSYHMFIYGMLLALSGDYTIYSNPESGKGRSDCMIKPMRKEDYAVVIEFKHKGGDGRDLKEEALKGLEQIEERDYIHSLRREGYKRIYKYGIAFHKKSCEVAMEKA